MFENNRILVVDDNESIHEDFKKILFNKSIEEENNHLSLEMELFGISRQNVVKPNIEYEIDFCFVVLIGVVRV